LSLSSLRPPVERRLVLLSAAMLGFSGKDVMDRRVNVGRVHLHLPCPQRTATQSSCCAAPRRAPRKALQHRRAIPPRS
jgi:hypothetical protein